MLGAECALDPKPMIVVEVLLWRLVIGVAAGIAGLLTDMEAIPEPLPSWVWYCLAVGTFVVAQFLAFYTVHKEVATHRAKPEPKQSLAEVYERLFGEMCGNEDMRNPEAAATTAIIEQALLGNLQVFGTTLNPDRGIGPMKKISKDFWENNTFRPSVAYGASQNELKERMHTHGSDGDQTYYNLKVDPAQVFLCWPQETRITWHWPITRETF